MPNIQITDSHCHLDFHEFEIDLSSVIQRANTAGVTRMVTICTKLAQEPQVKAIAEKYPSVFYAAGVHPMNAADHPLVTVEELLILAKNKKFVGIGETGLDYFYTRESASKQKESFEIHIEASRISGLPLIIHSRDADKEMIDMLTKEYKNGPFSCVMHCFSSGSDLAKTALELGFYLSMSGIVTFPKSAGLREIFASAPVNRILVETDSPYLAPPPFRGKRNEPSYSMHTAKVGAEIFGMNILDFAEQTQLNFNRLFKKATL